MADAHPKHHDYHLVDPSPWPALGLRAGLEEKRHALAISNGTDRRDARDRRR